MKPRWLWNDLQAWRNGKGKPVMVLTGARQVGKTTIAREVGREGFSYVALDDPMVRDDLKRVSAAALARTMPRAILDEVQKAPDLVEVVKAIVDGGGDERYLLLGSSQILLLERVRESLVGRTQLRRLWPLALAETLDDVATLGGDAAPTPFLADLLAGSTDTLLSLPAAVSLHPRAADLETARNRLLDIGGMPGLWNRDESAVSVREELETYVTLYLERDLRDLVRLRDLGPFVRLQRLAAERTAAMLNSSDLARDAGVSATTASTYLRYLELSFQVILLQPWYQNPSKRLVKSPRLHWADVGIWRAVTRTWGSTPGHLYESAMVAEINKVVQSFRLDWELFHLRTYDGREVDLLLVRGDEGIAIEIKSGDRVSRKDARHLRDLGELTGLRHPFSLVIYRGRELLQLDERIWAIPDVLLLGPAPPQ